MFLHSGGSSSAGPALVKLATARSFMLNKGIVSNIMSATPLEPEWYAVHSTPSRLLSASQKALTGFTVGANHTPGKAQMIYVCTKKLHKDD